MFALPIATQLIVKKHENNVFAYKSNYIQIMLESYTLNTGNYA